MDFEDIYEYVKNIMENYSDDEARSRINAFLIRDIEVDAETYSQVMEKRKVAKKNFS